LRFRNDKPGKLVQNCAWSVNALTEIVIQIPLRMLESLSFQHTCYPSIGMWVALFTGESLRGSPEGNQ
jgi:hypothetical protein